MKEQSNLTGCLSAVADPRRKQGQRYGSAALLLIIIMCALRNKFAYREIGRFCKNNKETLLGLFKFRNGLVPSHVTFYSFIRETDFSSLQTAFHRWAKDYVAIGEDEWISIDGKSIRSTASDYDNEYQNFVSLASLFCRKREQVLMVEKIENGKGNEGEAVERLLDMLDLKGATLTMDALHCKKNAGKDSEYGKPLRSQGKRQPAETESGA